jgi:hypothetical protein
MSSLDDPEYANLLENASQPFSQAVQEFIEAPNKATALQAFWERAVQSIEKVCNPDPS